MSTIVHCNVPAAEFALAETFQTVPEARIVCEQQVACATTDPFPLIWARTPEGAAFEDALTDDPTVASSTHLADTRAAQLYRMAWSDHIQLVVQMLTTANATILDAAGSAGGWQLRLLFPDREALRTTHDFCEEHNVALNIETIRTPDGSPSSQLGPGGGLTEDQYEALVCAHKQGYFSVPRTVDLETLAEEMDISHQALSERLRRAHNTLIGEALNSPSSESGVAPETSLHDS